MRELSESGLIEQPHTSAGRVPTVKGFRMYVQDFLKPTEYEHAVRKKFDSLKEQYFQQKDRERVYEAVALLSHMIQNVGFATVPHRSNVYYLGLAQAMKQPEFQGDTRFVANVVEVLEERLSSLLPHIEIDEKIRYYIGEKNVCKEFESCSLMVAAYRVRDWHGVIGILGPVRMDYGYNTVALDMVADLLRHG